MQSSHLSTGGSDDVRIREISVYPCTTVVPGLEFTPHNNCESEIQCKKGSVPGVPGNFYNYRKRNIEVNE